MSYPKVGDVVPSVDLWTSGNTDDLSACAAPVKISSEELFKGKKAVIFGLPIPFSPTCSMQQLPGFIQKFDDLKAKGIELVCCVDTYDVFVQDAWGKQQGANGKVTMLSDTQGAFLGPLNLTQDLSKGPMPLSNLLSKRFAMIVDDMKVTYFGIDEKGFSESSVEKVLEQL
ncbi:hypothetical protein HK101_001780 [Irineochytrium annulatum]|nr:hypothetical protein HK101_001780 [Irineochytrium annulatum]